VIVVDNAPEQLDPKYDVSESFPKVRWLQAPSVGLSNARNLATSASATPLIAFLDDDALASVDWLSSLVSAFEDFGEGAFAAGGRVEPLWLAPRPPWLPDELLGHLSLVGWGGERRALHSREWIAGTNMAFRVNELNRIGGFSAKFGRCGGEEVLLSNDENDVVSRLREQGGDIVYVPEAVVQHRVPPERLTQSWIRRRVVWQAISDYLQRPQEMFGKARGHWNAVERFVAGLPPEYQMLRSLCIEQSDPDVFQRQMSALYSHTIALLTGFHGVNA
jgi:GT2 family glycosyltransferase